MLRYGSPLTTSAASHLLLSRRLNIARLPRIFRLCLQEIVALSGAHALGRCHTDRSGFDGPWTRAPTTLSSEYFRLLLAEKWVPKVWSGPRQFVDERTKELMMLPSGASWSSCMMTSARGSWFRLVSDAAVKLSCCW